jgi:GntR family transcriptional regulator / MocR family aminotransferase
MIDSKQAFQFDLDDTNPIPIYRQIYRSVSQAILEGRLVGGTRLPSVRSLAAQLSVARGTIETAYNLLAGEGYIVARGAAGTRVNTHLKRSLLRQESLRVSHNERPLENPASLTEPKLFQMGIPALDGFPHSIWSRLLTKESRGVNPTYPHPMGLQALRGQIADYLVVARGIACTPEYIFITNGYQGALSLIAHSLLHPGDRVWMEDPGYPDGRDAMRLIGAEVIGVDVDRNGLDVQRAISRNRSARMVMVTPTHQYPTGVTLSLSRRIALLKWAAQTDAWIIEDDYDSEFRYQGKPLPALKSLDQQDRVLYAGTFSKVLSPSLRVGYLVVPRNLVEPFRKAASLLQPPPSAFVQAALAAFLEQGHLGRHIRRMRTRYAERRAALTQALHRRVGASLRIELNAGGMHLLGRLPKGTDDVGLVARLREHGLTPAALSGCGVEAPYVPGLLLGFTNVDSSKATEAARRLADAGLESLGARISRP